MSSHSAQTATSLVISSTMTKMRHFSRFWRLLPLASVLLTACTLTEQATTQGTGSVNDPQWQTHQQQLSHLSQYQTRGSFAYISPENKTYAKFFWQQYTPQNYRLMLTNPIGTRELELAVEPDLATLTTKDGKTHLSDVPSELIYQLTGMEIPINDLTPWLIGLPGRATHYTLDENHLLKSITFTQNGVTWQLDYLAYDTQTQPSLPSRLELSQGEQRIKLKMDSWTLNK